MSQTQNIGIVGQGFVGSAVKRGFETVFNIETYDKYKAELSTCSSLDEVADRCNFIFFCLPTPMRKSGICDLRIINTALEELDRFCVQKDIKRIAIVKSTVLPGTTEKWNASLENIRVVFNPEFLTEANAIKDFLNQTKIILGGPRPSTSKVRTLFSKAFPRVPIIKTSSTIAETVKYFTNCYLATKVSFCNEIKQVCDQLEIDYDKVVEYTLYDKRLGDSHWSVPGPDGDYGFGGHCFPKDLSAMIQLAKSLGVNPSVMQSAWDKNNEVRKDKDWLRMSGRAVSDD